MKKQMNLKFGLMVLTFFIANAAVAQSWQWGKRGGSIDPIQNWEEVKSIATDNDGNVYILAPVGISTLDIDGHPRETYGIYGGGSDASEDCVIASFACDGTYRWSKVIGGQDNDYMQALQTDDAGNVYAVGQVRNKPDDPFFPGSYPQVHFDSDVILPYSVSNNEGRQSLFIIKYNSEGVFQWLHMPQSEDVDVLDTLHSHSFDLQIDSEGNSYWLTLLVPGLYGNGTLNVSEEGYYVLHYNSSGIFNGATLLDVQVTGTNYNNFKLARNHSNGIIYLSAFVDKTISPPENIITNGEANSFSRIIAAFDNNGSFLWKRENNSTKFWSVNSYGITLEANNNIYLTGAAGTVNGGTDTTMESFNGVQFIAPANFNQLPSPYVIKLDPEGNTIWQTNGFLNYSSNPFAIAINGDEVAICGGQPGMHWGDITVPLAGGYDPYLARFNKTDGQIISIETFASTNNSEDYGTALTSDPQGNYFIGGNFRHEINVGGDILHNSGSEADFFVAKFGTDTCLMDTPEQDIKTLKAWPNPVGGILHLDNAEQMEYVLYNILGKEVQRGMLKMQGSIDFNGLGMGLYLLELKNGQERTTMKIVKE